MAQNTRAVTDGEFETLIQSPTPVLVDFWAEWCGPCRALAPVLDEMAGELGEKIVVAKMDIDANPMTPTKYHVRGIPTLMLFKEGALAGTKVGMSSKAQLREWVNGLL